MLVAVADGMGGHVAGDTAARVAMEAAMDSTNVTPTERVRAANEAILSEVDLHPELARMGTTMTLADLRVDGTAVLGHVGDSRAYLLRDGELRQLTVDHSVVAEYLAAGAIAPEDAATHPHRGMLTRAVGLESDIAVDEFEELLRTGDRLMLCSDGLNGMLADTEIARILAGGTPDEAVWGLIEAANGAGGHDNISIVIVDVGP